MAKKENKDIKKIPLANPKGKTVEELTEIVKTLQAQANQYREMAVKAQGAIEVILQMIPREEVEAMINEESMVNGELTSDTKANN